MELLFVILIAAGIGLIVRYASGRNRTTYGLLLIPGVSAAITAAVWVILLWLGFTFAGGWIWVISLIIGPGVGLALALRLPRTRNTHDRALLTKLSGGKA